MTQEWGYPGYDWLRFRRPVDGVLEVNMPSGRNLGAMDEAGHGELTRVWLDVEEDDDTRAVLLTGGERAFSAGGDLAMIERIRADFEVRTRMWRDARNLVYNMVNMTKPVVAAIRGPAVGAGLVAGLLADIPVAGRSARLIDGHTRLGVAAGDHATLIWPLLCGMAKAKYHLLLCEELSGEEAERLGLVALCVDDDAVEAEALAVARRLAEGPRWAIGWTKHALNNWLRMAMPGFDGALALEFLGFAGPESEAAARRGGRRDGGG